MKKVAVLVVIVLLSAVAFFIFQHREDIKKSYAQKKETIEIALTCKNAGGNYVAKYKECEYLNESQCSTLGGVSFDGCNAMCRHGNPNPRKACTQQCVSVCTLQ